MHRTPKLPTEIMRNLKSIRFVVFEFRDSVNIIKDAMRDARIPMTNNSVIKRNNDIAEDRHYIQMRPSLSITNNNTEQIEPMDLSCVKIANPANAVKHRNYFEPSNSDVPMPLPSNINEATLLILKSVYDIKCHRKPNCDQIFHEDPDNPKLYVCKVCAKHVRSKWHHFQTHYSRDHKCSDCDAVYSRIDTLRTHAKKRHHTIIPRYYYGIPANVWHRVVVQVPDPLPRPARPKPVRPCGSNH
ncbi:hypothetical protein QTP88_027909 [Uroleucon formosanum]